MRVIACIALLIALVGTSQGETVAQSVAASGPGVGAGPLQPVFSSDLAPCRERVAGVHLLRPDLSRHRKASSKRVPFPATPIHRTR